MRDKKECQKIFYKNFQKLHEYIKDKEKKAMDTNDEMCYIECQNSLDIYKTELFKEIKDLSNVTAEINNLYRISYGSQKNINKGIDSDIDTGTTTCIPSKTASGIGSGIDTGTGTPTNSKKFEAKITENGRTFTELMNIFLNSYDQNTKGNLKCEI